MSCYPAAMEALSSSSLPSSISEFSASPGLIHDSDNSSENDGGDSESATQCATLPSLSLDCAGPVSAASNVPETPLECISEDLELDVMKATCCDTASCNHQHDSCSDDMFASHFDEQESSLPRVDDLFPSLQSMGQDFSAVDGMYAWSVESSRGVEAFQSPDDEILQAESASCSGEDESASQMFAQWLQSNAHWISLSDLRKIKLKTSTIEDATRRLGGGKKGLMLFLKFVLMWVQNSRLKPATQLEEALTPVQLGTSACLGPSTMNDAATRTHVHNIASPLSPHMVAAQSCLDWPMKARWGKPPLVNPNVAPPITDFCHPSSAWLNHSNEMLRAGVLSSSLSACGNCSNIGCGGLAKDATGMMMLMQQQQHDDATPAATTRAARKSRMERQRWSVRHNSRWAHHQSQHRFLGSASAHPNSPAWTEVFANASQSFPHSSARSCQQQRTEGRSNTELQQTYNRPERNLRLLFQKELKQSDVGNLGRIVLPKVAETCLPPLELRDGLNLLVEDMNSSKVWSMRYRFWPNNKSRMYLLENASDFVKSYDLKEGDYMMLFCDIVTGKFVIRGVKGPAQTAAMSGSEGMECISDVPFLCNEVKKRRSLPQEEADCILMSSTNSEESCKDSLFAELIEQSLEDMKEL